MRVSGTVRRDLHSRSERAGVVRGLGAVVVLDTAAEEVCTLLPSTLFDCRPRRRIVALAVVSGARAP